MALLLLVHVGEQHHRIDVGGMSLQQGLRCHDRRGIRPVELSRYLGISTVAVAQCLRALERQDNS